MKILTIDDKKDNLISLTAMLRAFLPGCVTATAQSGPEGIEMARTFLPDTILLDIQMPGMDGFQVCKSLKSTPETQHIPIVFLTAQKTDPASRIQGLEIGGDAFLTKPVEPGELMAQIRAMVRIKLAEDALRKEKSNLEQMVAERTAALKAETTNLDAIFDSSPVAMLVLNKDRYIIRANAAALALVEDENLLEDKPLRPGEAFRCLHHNQDLRGCGQSQDCCFCPLSKALQLVLTTSQPIRSIEVKMQIVRDGAPHEIWLKVGAEPILVNGEHQIVLALDDITQHKRLEEERETTVQLLELINTQNTLPELIEAVTLLLQKSSGCQGVAIRLKDGYDYPYYRTQGFPTDFVEAEKSLCMLDARGQLERDDANTPRLVCMCGNVLCRRFDPTQKYFTKKGSFWTNSTTKLNVTIPDDGRPSDARNRCVTQGYESVALVAMRVGENTIGLLQLNDNRTERFSPERIAFFERIADNLAIALAHRQAHEEILRSERKFRSYIDHAPVGVFLIDSLGRYVEANPTGLRMLGYSEAELLQLSVPDVVAPDDREASRQRLAILFSKGRITGVVHLQRKDGTQLWTSLVAIKLDDNRFLACKEDITHRKVTEKALARNEARLRRAEEIAGFGTWEISISNCHIDASENTRRLYGLFEQNVSLEEVQSCVLSEDRPMLDIALRGLIEAGRPYDVEFKIQRARDGQIIHLHSIAEYDAANRMVFGVVHDITERKKSEEALSDSEEHYHLLFDQMISGIIVCEVLFDESGEPCDYLFQQANLAAEKLSGIDRSLVVGKKGSELKLGWNQTVLQNCFKVAITREPIHYERYNEVLGRYFDNRVFSPKKGQFALVFNDITNRKQAEMRNRELADLLDQTSDAIIVRKLDGAVTHWNLGAEKIFGWTSLELIGRQVTELFPQASIPKVIEAEKYLTKHGHWTGEMNYVSKSGRQIIGHARATLTDGSILLSPSILVIITDITEKKQIEAQFLRSQRMESIGTLASGVAHDLNNVLAPILMSLPLLRNKLDPEELEQTIDGLESSVKRGALIIKQLLTFGRGLGSEQVTVQIKHLLKEMDAIAHETFPKNITLFFDTAPDLWLLRCDPTQCHQILLNLCINARDAMLEGGILRVKTENRMVDEDFASLNPDARPGPYIRIQVSDTGTGIAPEHIDKIFDPFFTTKDYGKGTGLGLPTVIGIVKSHKGFFTVSSTLGQGTSFEIFLPASPEAQVAPAAQGTIVAPQGSGETILIVDDEDAIRGMTRKMLTTHGYETLCAADGIEALNVLARNRRNIRLIITDYMMPGINGLELVRAVRRFDPEIKIILSSGLGDLLDEGLQSEMNALNIGKQITKPYSSGALLSAMHSLLKPEVVD